MELKEMKVGTRLRYGETYIQCIETPLYSDNPCWYCHFFVKRRIEQCPYLKQCISTKREDRKSVIFTELKMKRRKKDE
jgi:hypothetical protein